MQKHRKVVGVVLLFIILLIMFGCNAPKYPGNGSINNIVVAGSYAGCDINGYTKETVMYGVIPEAYDAVVSVDTNLVSYDIYTPTTVAPCTKKFPVMIYVHGGGWQKGDKANPGSYTYKVPYFVSQGFVFVSVNYRLAPGVMYPVFNQDAADAVANVLKNAIKYNIDSSKVTIMGHSAGGGIITSVSTDERYLTNAGFSLSALRCAVSLDTQGYDITTLDDGDQVAPIYDQAFGTDAKVRIDASPINHIASGKGIPSFFIVTRGTKQRSDMAKDFESKLKTAGVTTTLIETPSLDHEGVNDAVGKPTDTLVTPPLQKFLETNCLG